MKPIFFFITVVLIRLLIVLQFKVTLNCVWNNSWSVGAWKNWSFSRLLWSNRIKQGEVNFYLNSFVVDFRLFSKLREHSCCCRFKLVMLKSSPRIWSGLHFSGPKVDLQIALRCVLILGIGECQLLLSVSEPTEGNARLVERQLQGRKKLILRDWWAIVLV